MNRHEFYDSLNKYKSLTHTQYGNGYVHKIDNFYGWQKPRYFYSEEEWQAYQKEKNAEKEKRQELVDKAKEHNTNVQKKNNLEKAYNKNKSAGEAQALEERKRNDPNYVKKLEEAYKKNEDAAKALEIENRNKDFTKKKENNPQMLNKNGDWRNDRGEKDMAWALFTEKGGLDVDLPYYMATLVRGEREPSDDRKEYCENIIDTRYNKKEAEECKKLINNIVEDAENIKNQILDDDNMKEFLDEFQESVNNGGWNWYEAKEKMLDKVDDLFNYYLSKSKYSDYYWQDSSHWKWKSGGLVVGNMLQRSVNAIKEIMQNMIKEYKEKKNKKK